MNYISYLFLLKTGFLLFLGCDVIIFALGLNIVAFVLLVVGLALMRKLYCCPECKCHLDFRIPLRELNNCPSCGCDFASHDI